jgi:hypothetical protein
MAGTGGAIGVRVESRLLMRVLVAIVVLAGVAEARPMKEYRGVVANLDGTAWVLVRNYHSTGGGDVDDSVVLHRVVDRALVPEQVPTRSILEGIAGRLDGSLWVLTTDSVLARASDGKWREVPVPAVEKGKIGRRLVVPLSSDRAVVLRTCFECSDVWTVDVKASTIEGPSRVGVEIYSAVPDGRGGLWAIVPKRQFNEKGGTVRTALGGYAHFVDGNWEAWTTTVDPIDGIAAIHHTDVDPVLLAGDGRGGALALRSDGVVAIDPAGHLVGRGWIMSRNESSWPEALIANGDGALLVTGRDPRSVSETVDATPVLHWFAATPASEVQTERLSTTAAWRAAHEIGTPRPWVATAGERVWIVMPDVIFVREHGEWHRLDANPAAPLRFVQMYSVPIELGYATRHGAPNGASVGLRPELMWYSDRNYRRFGFGGYLEGVAADLGTGTEALVGGGLTIVGYGTDFGGGLSVGADARFADGTAHPQLVVSGYLGIHSTLIDDRGFDSPLGLRVDVRPGTREVPASVTASVAVDTIGLALRAYYLAAVLTAHPH